MTSCPECGAVSVEGKTCWEILGEILAWEYTDPALQAEHFLTVACYNLQHPAQFTDDAIAGLRDALRRHLDDGVAVAHLRRLAGHTYSGQQRVLKPKAERRPIPRRWTFTISDVYLDSQPIGAAERVRAWAAASRREMSDSYVSGMLAKGACHGNTERFFARRGRRAVLRSDGAGASPDDGACRGGGSAHVG